MSILGRNPKRAQAHFISAHANILFADLDSVLHQVSDPVSGGVQFDGPHVLVPDTPGHVADLDPAYLETLEKSRSAREQLGVGGWKMHPASGC